MVKAIAREDRAALELIVAAMEGAWNAGDAAAFAAPFAIDGDQVNIFGALLKDRDHVASQHERIFASIFRGSHNALRIVDARYVTPDVVLARVSSVVEVPEGPLRGKLETLASVIFRRNGPRWELVTFHNTRVATGPQ